MRGKTVLPCRPRRDAKARRCPHGRDISCPTRHVEDDPRLGRPMCGDCYDYQAAVLFNACAGDLWRRFTTYLPRQLARLTGVSLKDLGAAARIRYVKVAEYQARGVVHFHAVIRLDANSDDYRPPPATVHRRRAVRRHRPGRRRRFARRWPGQRTCPARLRPANRRPDHPPGQRPARHRAGPVGSGRGELHRQVRHQIPDRPRPPGPAHPHHLRHAGHLRCSAHFKRMIVTAWQLGAKHATGDPRLRQWAHMLGYGGHFLTKSAPLLRHLRPAPRRPHRAPPHPAPPRR